MECLVISCGAARRKQFIIWRIMPEISPSIPVATPPSEPAGQTTQPASHDEVILARHTPMTEPALMDALPSSEPLAPEAEKIEREQAAKPAPQVPVLSDLVAPFNMPTQNVPAIEYVPTETLHHPVIAQPMPLPRVQPAAPPPVVAPKPVVPPVEPKPVAALKPAVPEPTPPPVLQSPAAPAITIPVADIVPGPAAPPVKGRTLTPPAEKKISLEPLKRPPPQPVEAPPAVAVAPALTPTYTPTAAPAQPAAAPAAAPEIAAPVPPAAESPAAPIVAAAPPAMVAPPREGTGSPLKIYSHNTQAVWQVRRATRMLYMAAVLTVIGLLIIIGIYWVSIGAPTNVKDLPVVQNSVK